MKKPGITFIIQAPSQDLDNDTYDGVKFYIRGVVHNVTQIRDLCQIPDHVLAFVIKTFAAGDYRAEVLSGSVMYKFYKKVEREILPQEQDNTKLEQFQKTLVHSVQNIQNCGTRMRGNCSCVESCELLGPI